MHLINILNSCQSIADNIRKDYDSDLYEVNNFEMAIIPSEDAIYALNWEVTCLRDHTGHDSCRCCGRWEANRPHPEEYSYVYENGGYLTTFVD